MLGCVGARVRQRCWFRRLSERLPTLTAELNRRGIFEAAARTPDLQRRAALAAELYAARVFEAVLELGSEPIRRSFCLNRLRSRSGATTSGLRPGVVRADTRLDVNRAVQSS